MIMYATCNNETDVLARPFVKMGARVKFGETHPDRRGVELDVRTDNEGEYLTICRW